MIDRAAVAAELKVVAHRDRLRVLEAVERGDVSAKAVAGRYGLKVPAVSYHSVALAEAGFAWGRVRYVGRWRGTMR